MSLKDRLKNQNNCITEDFTKELPKPVQDDFYITKFKKLLEENTNILVCCPIKVPTYNAINFLCSKIPNDKRLVGIGSNLLLNPDEIIKFEPEIKENSVNSKQIIKTAMSLNPYKIIMQNFDGVEAVDIFKLINGGIKNVICAVTAQNAQKALSQAELNLYVNGATVPESVMKQMLSELFDVIIVVDCDEKFEGNCTISDMYEVKPFENGEYQLIKISKNNKSKAKSKKQTETQKEIKPKNKFIEKLKKKKISIK